MTDRAEQFTSAFNVERNLVYFRKLQELQLLLMDRMQENGRANGPSDPFCFGRVQSHFFDIWNKNPADWMHSQTQLVMQSMQLWHDLQNQPEKQSSDNPYDRYFKGEAWNDSLIFRWVKESYILAAEWMIDRMESETLGMPDEERERLRFFTRQFIEAMSPRNFPLTNPDVIKEILDTGGQNLIDGLDNLIRDIRKGHKFPAIKMTDEDAFKVGENLAITKGDVVFENKLFELIQYRPTTENVYKTPVMICPPWINKYYVLDLQPENSLVKWMVDQGHTVFMISWANPDSSFRDIAFQDYCEQGLMEALRVANDICKTQSAHVMGYCIGGTLTAMTLAHCKAQGIETPIASATFLTTLLDFEQAGELKIFIDKDQVETLNNLMADQGILEAETLRMTFSMLRASDLIWSFVINNYLMGRDPAAFDLLYWNSDSTNLPAAMHSDYLTSMYLNNDLAKGRYRMGDKTLDISTIDVPCYFLSTQDDHIAPWGATFDGAQIMKNANKRFVLAGSGHVAGVINPPHKNKYGYKTAGIKKGQSAAKWLNTTDHHDGSWWQDWHLWCDNLNTDLAQRKAPKTMGNKNFTKKRASPGKNVLRKA